MKISKFIEELEKFNPDADITLTTSETITLSYITGKDNEYTPENTPIVFIEPADICVECTSEYMNGDEKWCSFYDRPCIDVEECFQFEEFVDP